MQQICMQEAGQIDRATPRTRAQAWEDWASTTALASGALMAHPWIKQLRLGQTRQWTQTGLQSSRKSRLNSFLVVSTMLPSYHVHPVTTCVTSAVRSARFVQLVPATCTQPCI